jgi:hypothetical protein
MNSVPEQRTSSPSPLLGLAAADGLTTSPAAATPQTEQVETVACSGRAGASQLKRRQRATAFSSSCGMSALHVGAAERDLGSSLDLPVAPMPPAFSGGPRAVPSIACRSSIRSSLTGTWRGAFSDVRKTGAYRD